MNCSVDFILTTTNWIKSTLKIVSNFLRTKVPIRSNLNLLINMIPFGLWQLKTEFEDSLINFKILLLKAEKFSDFLIFKSNLFNSMTVNVKKIDFLKKLCLALKWVGNVIIRSCIMFFANGGSILKRYSGDWSLNILERWRGFLYDRRLLTPVFYKVFLWEYLS